MNKPEKDNTKFKENHYIIDKISFTLLVLQVSYQVKLGIKA